MTRMAMDPDSPGYSDQETDREEQLGHCRKCGASWDVCVCDEIEDDEEFE